MKVQAGVLAHRGDVASRLDKKNGILFNTPHQLSSEAKRVLTVTPPENFLTFIKGGGYFEKTKGLDRIYDIGVLLHKCEMSNGDFLHVVVDKHRFPSVIDSSLKSFYLPMPSNKMPIPANVDDPLHKPMRRIPRGGASTAKSEDSKEIFSAF